MIMQLSNVTPVLEEEGKEVKEYVNVSFVTSLTPDEYEAMKKKTKGWVLEVEIKD